MIQYEYNSNKYDDFDDIKKILPHISFPGIPSDDVLASIGIVVNDVTVVDTTTYSIYCYIGSNSPTTVPSTNTYTPSTNEILMATVQTDGTQVAKEDGTWVTPPSEYTVYKCVDGKLAIDVNDTYGNIARDYEPQYNTLQRGIGTAIISLYSNKITQVQYDSNMDSLSASLIALTTQLKTEQEVAING